MKFQRRLCSPWMFNEMRVGVLKIQDSLVLNEYKKLC